MSTGGTGGHVNYGPSAPRRSLDTLEEQDPKGAAAGWTGEDHKGLLGTLKEALRPSDARKPKMRTSDTTRDGRHSSIEEAMKPSAQAYDEPVDSGRESYRDARDSGSGVFESMIPGRKRHSDLERGGGILNALMPGSSGRDNDGRKWSSAMGSMRHGSTGRRSGSEGQTETKNTKPVVRFEEPD
ncbi:hypothetical protein F5B20DRAFT_575881 [Whalleya microplaca]|nr:hypothetical protein F5B20DRAFT_575881 [Whalleya microplaca]